jgi:hypothetical protein
MGRWKNPDSHYLDREQRVLERILEQPGIERNDLCKTFRSLGRQLLTLILKGLAEDGEIRIERVETKGRPKHRYWPNGESQPVRAKDRLAGVPVPAEEERKGLLNLIAMSDPERIDWAAIKRIVDEAYG